MIKNSSKFYFGWLAFVLAIAVILGSSLFAAMQVGQNHAKEWQQEAVADGYSNVIYMDCHGTITREYNGEKYLQLRAGEVNDDKDIEYTYYLIPLDTKNDYQKDMINSIAIFYKGEPQKVTVKNQEAYLLDAHSATFTAIQAETVIFIIISLAFLPMLVAAIYLTIFGLVKRNEEKANLPEIEVDMSAFAKKLLH